LKEGQGIFCSGIPRKMEQLVPGKLGINKLLLNDLIAVNISVIAMQLPVT
jgi:hypothetical protein|tara:strand:+ start:103 stop:252 length:150 start_codon:yes stop_codon:yes gene_type:complete